MLNKLKSFAVKIIDHPLYFWLAVAVVYILARVATWGYPYDSDHWIFYYVGKIWADGGTLYIDAWDHKPPMIFLFNGLMHLIFGGNIIWHRIWLTLLSFVDIVLFYKILKQIIPKLFEKIAVVKTDFVVKIGLLLYVFLRNLSQFTSSGNNTENYGLIFLLGMWLSYLSFRKDRKWWKLLISGALCSVLFFLKGNFVLLGLPIGIMLIVDNFKNIKKFLLEAIIFVAPIIVHALAWVWYFSARDALNEFWIATYQFSAKYSGSAWSGDLSSNIILLLVTLILVLPAILFFLVYLRDVRKNLRNHDYLFVGMSFITGLVLTFGVGSFYSYYFEILMPIIVLVIVYALFRLLSFKKFWKISLMAVLAGSLILSYGVSIKQLYNSLGGSVNSEASQYQEVANYINANTTNDDKVFCYDYGASFYQLSNRDSGSRFVSASVLLLEYRDNYGFGFDDIFIEDMEKSRAKYVVTYINRETLYYANEPIVEYFDRHYVIEKRFDTLEVLRRID